MQVGSREGSQEVKEGEGRLSDYVFRSLKYLSCLDCCVLNHNSDEGNSYESLDCFEKYRPRPHVAGSQEVTLIQRAVYGPRFCTRSAQRGSGVIEAQKGLVRATQWQRPG